MPNNLRFLPRGFTLLELMVTLAVVAILMVIGIPSFSSQINSTKVKTSTYSLYEAVQVTRSKAISLNSRVTLKKQNNWKDGWEIFIDNNSNGLREDDEQLLQVGKLPPNIKINPNKPVSNYISYVGSGESRMAGGESDRGAFQAGTFKLCPSEGGAGYKLILSRSGRMRVEDMSVAECEKDVQP